MKVESLIQASWFYTDETGKTKLNWFLYEYACKLFEHIDESQRKALGKWKARRSDGQIAEFCAYFSKRARQSALAFLEGPENAIIMPEYFVTDYCHTNTQRESKAIMGIASAAWAELLQTCSACPCNCIDERYMRCEFFDRMGRGGYLS